MCEELSRRGQEVAGPKAKGTWKVDVGDMALSHCVRFYDITQLDVW